MTESSPSRPVCPVCYRDPYTLEHPPHDSRRSRLLLTFLAQRRETRLRTLGPGYDQSETPRHPRRRLLYGARHGFRTPIERGLPDEGPWLVEDRPPRPEAPAVAPRPPTLLPPTTPAFLKGLSTHE